jgi:hypothetical protein
MRRAPRTLLASLLITLTASLAPFAPAAHAASPERVTLVTCAPGFPGTTEEAQPAMDGLAAVLGRRAALPDGALGAVYLPAEAEGVARLGAPDAALALVSLPFYLAHGAALGLTPRLLVERSGGTLLERWTLVARKGRVAKAEDLAGLTVSSTAGYAPAFVRGVIGAWGRLPPSAAVAATSQILSALRKAAGGAAVAVLLDGPQAEALSALPFAGDLEVVTRSAPVPVALLATVGPKVQPARWAALERALLGLAAEPQGAAALAGVRMVRFAPLDAAALSTAQALYRSPAAEPAR